MTATFITLRSIVLVEILGIQKLTNAFGLTVLFQGIAVLLGSPISGDLLSYDLTNLYHSLSRSFPLPVCLCFTVCFVILCSYFRIKHCNLIPQSTNVCYRLLFAS